MSRDKYVWSPIEKFNKTQFNIALMNYLQVATLWKVSVACAICYYIQYLDNLGAEQTELG